MVCTPRSTDKLSFIKCVGEAFEPVLVEMSVMRLIDFDEMPLIIPS